ncbi:benzaldehyde dehydrogenase [Rhodococcus sp. NPDC060176]|uniref:benzaldehyde dehydrogenase n=1 Tax=Rhodococcus sp. NPDC060176 TaxID=3347062 RepID=UPI003656550C
MTFLNENLWDGNIFSGSWINSIGGDADVVSPSTGEVIGMVGIAEAEDVSLAARSATQAQRAWASRPYTERAAVLRRAGQLWEEHAAEIGDWLVREAGAIPAKAAVETTAAAQECYEAAALASRAIGGIIPSAESRMSLVRRRPVGLVGVISPFNAPLVLSIRSVAPALALGNGVILKPDVRTAVSGGIVVARIFEEAGLPDGVLHVLPGGVDVGEALVEDPNVRVISFTGSTAAGKRVGELASRHLKRAHLELGGNSALIVMPDADLDLAASAGAWGSFLHQGQICMTTGRHIVHKDILDSYLERLADKANRLPVGDPSTHEVALGPIIDERQRDKIHNLVLSSVEAGATLVAGGTYEDLFYRPTVLANVTQATPAYAQEVFGPVAPVISFSDEKEAIALANATEYGLSLGILSNDVMGAVALADQIPSGIVHINDQTVGDEALAPFGGVGASGTGSRFGGPEANVEAFTEAQWLTLQGAIQPHPF